MAGEVSNTNATTGVTYTFNVPENLKPKGEHAIKQPDVKDLLSQPLSKTLLSPFTMSGKIIKHTVTGAILLDKEEFFNAFGESTTKEQPIPEKTDNEAS